MKMLFLIRHAKSSWDDMTQDDLDRPLNDRGQKDAPRMGKRLKERNIFPDVIYSSPAKRAFDTGKLIAKALGFPHEKIKRDKKLYHANEDQLLRFVQKIKDRNDSEEVIMIFGHNPGLTDFANALLNESIENIPTCGIVAAKINVRSWKETKLGSGTLTFFDFPKKSVD